MKCPRCQADNKVGRKFCRTCRQGLPFPCPQCDFINDPDDQFCGGCGASLSSQPQPSVSGSTFQVSGSQPLAPSNELSPPLAAARQATRSAQHVVRHYYNWFTEGFDTKDLQEAKVLLEELNH